MEQAFLDQGQDYGLGRVRAASTGAEGRVALVAPLE